MTGRYYMTPHGTLQGTLFVFDIEERKRYEKALIAAKEEAEKSAQAKSSFLANMSHEIRTPMNAIMRMSELLLEIAPGDEEREMARLIDNGAKDLMGILNQVLDLSRIDSGSYQLNLEPTNVALLLEDCAKLYEQQANAKELEYAVDVSVDTALRLADPQLIRQVLSNLIGNAIKFTEEGTILIRANMTPSNDVTDILTRDVIDTGAGISDEHQKVIFDRFEQADSSTTRKYGGTGSGLTITRELVLLMGGEIKLVSALGEGSRFHIMLPLRHVAEEAATVHQLPSPDTLKGSALVVDDIESNRMALSRLLNLMGMQTAAVANASAAVTALAKQPVDVVVTDLHMPNASGLELLEMIRRGIHPNVNKETPVVFLTADVISSDKQAAEALGISGWLHKPMNRKEIGQVLNAVLQGKETYELTQAIPTEDTKDKASLKAWNRAEMAERMVDNDVLLNNICSLFLDNLPQLQSSIQVAYSSRDAEEGALQAHTLKGAAANASAEQLHAVAKGLENAFRAANWERVERYVKELPEAIRVTEDAMLAHQERSQS
jgi:CheY-like chemotaxis protein/nitrogen-specific signal transduction histidine kinase